MSILKTVQMFIAMNPGSTTRDIIEGLTQFSQDRLQLAVCRLYGSGLATRKRDGRQFRYYAEPPADCHFEVFEPTPEVERSFSSCRDDLHGSVQRISH
ncbi:hypothetical protein [Citrobacter freundii]|uniref:ArsR family transcriptional regulator n=1 Tax=Citrobacter freundii TaxID=546 RepID=A0ABY7L626_CITFR|nr:hypothetical protein [Citrobacter freundii]MCR3686945.1 hypothetical protein [Citrobacter freundii]MDH0243542.1 hypothetical protein [Citrobacter freundii]MDH1351111.1 hypothetical protein [Citrobacter freundii]MDO3404438.1 hypothetical protein [Citrobacter freundii]MDT7169228.1 hypothetical protein [Citrobacter freundii]